MTEIPYGYCHCGCGEKTKPAVQTRTKDGVKKGEPQRFVYNHHIRRPEHKAKMLAVTVKRVRWIAEDRGFSSPCWIWQLAKDQWGYGRVGGGLAHRLMYEERNGPIPDGLEIDHLCRQPSCVNPDHLEPVLHLENVRRGARPKLTVEDVERIKRLLPTKQLTEIAREFGVSKSTIWGIAHKKVWKEVAHA